MFLLKELKEYITEFNLNDVDSAWDLNYKMQKIIIKNVVPLLETNLKQRGDKNNTPGCLNVAIILTEKFDDYDFTQFPQLQKLANKCLELLESNEELSKHRDFHKLTLKLRNLSS